MSTFFQKRGSHSDAARLSPKFCERGDEPNFFAEFAARICDARVCILSCDSGRSALSAMFFIVVLLRAMVVFLSPALWFGLKNRILTPRQEKNAPSSGVSRQAPWNLPMNDILCLLVACGCSFCLILTEKNRILTPRQKKNAPSSGVSRRALWNWPWKKHMKKAQLARSSAVSSSKNFPEI